MEYIRCSKVSASFQLCQAAAEITQRWRLIRHKYGLSTTRNATVDFPICSANADIVPRLASIWTNQNETSRWTSTSQELLCLSAFTSA